MSELSSTMMHPEQNRSFCQPKFVIEHIVSNGLVRMLYFRNESYDRSIVVSDHETELEYERRHSSQEHIIDKRPKSYNVNHNHQFELTFLIYY